MWEMMVRAVRRMVGNGARGSSEFVVGRDMAKGWVLMLTAGG